MQDLDIRGAGNLLGAEQSGFIADLGYETYQKILSEAVTELKNDEFADLYADELKAGAQLSGDVFVDDCSVECDLKAYFPEDYVPGSSERMLLYRELDALNTDEQLAAFRRRMEDRFGPLPPEGEELLLIAPLLTPRTTRWSGAHHAKKRTHDALFREQHRQPVLQKPKLSDASSTTPPPISADANSTSKKASAE